MVDRTALRIAAATLLVGQLIFILAGLFHPGHEDANDHPAVFAEYAESASWTAVHLVQFLGVAVVVAGLLALLFALNVNSRAAWWLSWAAGVAAIVALALYGVLQAVDGVALKQSVDAWADAPSPERTATFATAEGIRWLEWGARSYHSLMLGVALVLVAAVVVLTGRPRRVIGYLAGLTGLSYIAQGLIVGFEGFSATNEIAITLGLFLGLAWIVVLAVISWRMRAPDSGRHTTGVR